MIKLGALWIRNGQKGEFFAGKLGEASIMIFPNTQKNAPNQPDFNIFIAEDKSREKSPNQQGQQPQKRTWGNRPPKNYAPQGGNGGNDDAPF